MKFNNVFIDANGYAVSNKEYVHRLVVENALGRKLKGKECVHHVNEIKTDYSNKNLVLCQDAAYHKLLHARQRVVDLDGNPNTDKYCTYHKCLHDKSLFSTAPSNYDNLSASCRSGINKYRSVNGLSKNKWTWKRGMDQQYRRSLKKETVCEV